MHRKLMLTFAILVITTAVWAGVSHYQLEVELDDLQKLIWGTAKVDYINRSSTPLAEVYFRLPANQGKKPNPKLAKLWNDSGYLRGFDPSWTEIDKVTDDLGHSLEFIYEDALPIFQNYSLERGFVKVALPEVLEPGERTTWCFIFALKCRPNSEMKAIMMAFMSGGLAGIHWNEK